MNPYIPGLKIRTDLIPPEAIRGTARVLTYGAKKYDDRNWERGLDYSRIYGALLRHILAWWEGEDLDPESGLNHLHHVGCCAMFLQTFVERGMNWCDDRPKPEGGVRRDDLISKSSSNRKPEEDK